MSHLLQEDKGKVDVPKWISQVYADEVLRSVAAKKKVTSAAPDDLPKVCQMSYAHLCLVDYKFRGMLYTYILFSFIGVFDVRLHETAWFYPGVASS